MSVTSGFGLPECADSRALLGVYKSQVRSHSALLAILWSLSAEEFWRSLAADIFKEGAHKKEEGSTQPCVVFKLIGPLDEIEFRDHCIWVWLLNLWIQIWFSPLYMGGPRPALLNVKGTWARWSCSVLNKPAVISPQFNKIGWWSPLKTEKDFWQSSNEVKRKTFSFFHM